MRGPMEEELDLDNPVLAALDAADWTDWLAQAGLPAGGRIAAMMIETPANPTNDLVDITHCARMAAGLEGQPGGRPAGRALRPRSR